ncbi:MAG: peptidylprolyl isomerase [Phycisphaerales bacterium]|nr:peptidylprolyl isomerase [Phycisphaerales bacterium]
MNVQRLVRVFVLTCVLAAGLVATAQDGDALVIVNGRSIPRQKLYDLLVESHGLSVLQQLVALELAKEETARLKLRVTPEDVEVEFRRAMDNIAPRVGEGGQVLDEDARRQSLDFLLQQKGLSMAEFNLAMERNAHLRKIVERGIVVDEAVLREEFARLYGEKVEVRAIQVGQQAELAEALAQLEKGTDFAEVAERVSRDPVSAPRGGLLEPFAFNDERVAPVLREAAFELSPGQRTPPIRSGSWWFILKLERRIAPQDVAFEAVRAEVERKFKERIAPERMSATLLELYRKAQIRVLDRGLRPKFEELMKRDQARPTGP